MASIERQLLTQITPYLHTHEAIVITGMRQVGKTTLLKQIRGIVGEENSLFFDMENASHQQFFSELDYDVLWRKLVGQGLNPDKPVYIFLDEIQLFPNIPSIVKYLHDHYKVKFFLTGSASYYIKNLFSESLSGRKFLFELFPFSFAEFLSAKNKRVVPPLDSMDQITYGTYQALYEEYITYGGFPEVVFLGTPQAKEDKLNDILSSYFQLEVKALSDFKKNNSLRELVFLLFTMVGSKIDISKLAVELEVSRPTVKEYLAFLQDTYLFHTIASYSRNVMVRTRKQKKVYCIDSGFARCFGKIAMGHVFENAVFHQLRLHHKQLHYYSRKSGVEIDFIGDGKVAYEVKSKADDHDVKKLSRLAVDVGIPECKVISYQFTKSPVWYGSQF